jgi:hypothetical protein
MKKLFAAACLVLGVACGPAIDPIEDEVIKSVEQELCPATCPAGTRFVQYVWLCTGQTSSACPSGIEKEYASCYDSSNGSYVTGTTTCRTRCGCFVAEEY